MQDLKSSGEFSLERLQVISSIEQDHFWFLGRRKLVLSLMRKLIKHQQTTLLDVGCGTGYNLKHWKAFSKDVFGLDRLSGDIGPEIMAGISPNMVKSDVCALPVKSDSTDVVVALDVLEHVQDGKMLAEVNRCLVDEGLLFITVPAMQWLWSDRDESAGHLRRYNKQTLRPVIEKAGFEILYMSYYQCLLFPLVALARIMGRTGKSTTKTEENPGKKANALLGLVTQFEVSVSALGFRFPWGSSLVAVMRKTPV